MKKGMSLLMSAVLFLCLLTGCGGDKSSAVTETTIEVKKNGTIVHTIIEEFTEQYYGLEGLTDTMQKECDEYNERAGKKAVTVNSAAVQDDILTVVMTYSDASAYSGFNNQALFAGTIKDAYNAGYDLDVTLNNAKEGESSFGREELLNMGEKHIVIVREAVNLKVYGKILCYSQDVLRTDNSKTVRVTDNDILTYLVFD